MRRTPREDIEFIKFFIDRDCKKYWYTTSSVRYFYKHLMSFELANILQSMCGDFDKDNSFSATDETYLKALDILKMIIEEE